MTDERTATSGRNRPPVDVWEALRRLLNCNRQQLASHLGVSRHTLQRWEKAGRSEAAAATLANLLEATLRAADAARPAMRNAETARSPEGIASALRRD